MDKHTHTDGRTYDEYPELCRIISEAVKEKTAKFTDLGELGYGPDIYDRAERDRAYLKFIGDSLKRYVSGDWGDMDEDNKEYNDKIITGLYGKDQIMARYNYPGGGDIDIITFEDRIGTLIRSHEDDY